MGNLFFKHLFGTSSDSTQQEYKEYVQLLYRLMFNRDADREGLNLYVTKMHDGLLPSELLKIFSESPEYQRLIARDNSSEGDTTPEEIEQLSDETKRLSDILRNCEALENNPFATLYNSTFSATSELIIGQADYAKQHKNRFWELFNAVSVLTKDTTHPKILEFGISEFSAFHTKLFPQNQYDAADRPVPDDYIGFTEKRARQRTSCNNYYSIDLNRVEKIGETLPSSFYDLIVFCEVLEHLVVDPISLVQALMASLKKDGYLYLTTPNFFSIDNRRKLEQKKNPQEFYPKGEGNWDAHHHFREYSMPELIEIANNTGSQVAACYYSSCWDTEDETPAGDNLGRSTYLPPQSEYGNLVLVLKKAGSD